MAVPRPYLATELRAKETGMQAGKNKSRIQHNHLHQLTSNSMQAINASTLVERTRLCVGLRGPQVMGFRKCKSIVSGDATQKLIGKTFSFFTVHWLL